MATDPNNPFAHLMAPPAPAGPAPTPAPAPQARTPMPPAPQLVVPRGVAPTETPEFRAAVTLAEARAKAAAAAEAEAALTEDGKLRFRRAISFLRDKYNALHKRGEMISEKNPWYDNLSNWSEAQAVSLIGNPTGSKNQSDRESIINQRNILIPLLLQASGANSRMIDSNSEAQRFLSAVTSPTQSYETVMDSLDNIESLFGGAVKSLRDQARGDSLLPSPPKFKVKRRK
jgi:hypothetical protein